MLGYMGFLPIACLMAGAVFAGSGISATGNFAVAAHFNGLIGVCEAFRLRILGICSSGSFVISAAKIDPRMKAIAAVSMYDMRAANRDGLLNSANKTLLNQVNSAKWNLRGAKQNILVAQCMNSPQALP